MLFLFIVVSALPLGACGKSGEDRIKDAFSDVSIDVDRIDAAIKVAEELEKQMQGGYSDFESIREKSEAYSVAIAADLMEKIKSAFPEETCTIEPLSDGSGKYDLQVRYYTVEPDIEFTKLLCAGGLIILHYRNPEINLHSITFVVIVLDDSGDIYESEPILFDSMETFKSSSIVFRNLNRN